MFENIDYKTAEEWLKTATGTVDESPQKFYEGDHWQGGKGWLGIVPADLLADFNKENQKIFVSKNMIKEVVDRNIDAVIGGEPSWSIVSDVPELENDQQEDEAQNELISPYEMMLTKWWNDKNVLETIQTNLPSLLYAARAVWRIYISPAAISGDEKVGDLARVDSQQAGRYVYLEPLPIKDAAVFHNKELAQDIGIYRYESDEKKEIELSYVDEEGFTNIVILNEQGIVAQSTLDLNGKLPIFELSQKMPFVSPSMVRNQMAINLAETMKVKNTNYAGHSEWIFFNATSDKKSIPRGPGVNHYIFGAVDENGDLTNPQFVQPETFDPSRLILTSQSFKASIYEEAKQMHVMISGDSTASGESRIQAMGDFKASLNHLKTKVDNLLRWVLAVSLDIHLLLTRGTPDKASRVDASANVTISVPNTNLIKLAQENASYQFWSQETALTMSGIEDPAAEMERIERERQKAMEYNPDTMGALYPEDEPFAQENINDTNQ